MTQAKKVKLIHPSDLLKSSFQEYKKLFRKLVLIQIVPIAISLLRYIPMFSLTYIRSLKSVDFISTAIPYLHLLVSVTFSVLAFIATIYLLHDVSLSVTTAYKQALKKLPFVICLSILGSFITLGGLVFFILPGMFISIRLWPKIYIYITEGKQSLLKIFTRSWFYTKDYFWGIYLRRLLIVLVGLAYYVPYFIIYFPTSKAMLANHVSFIFPGSLFLIGLSIFSYFILTPITQIYLYKLYKNLAAIRSDKYKYEDNKGSNPIFITFGLIGVSMAALLTVLIILALIFGPKIKQQNEQKERYYMTNLESALARYKNEKGIYPNLLTTLKPIYISSIKDPLTSKPYTYITINKNTGYLLCSQYRTKDPVCVSK